MKFSQTHDAIPETYGRTKSWITCHTCNKKGNYSKEYPEVDGVNQYNNGNKEANKAISRQEDED